MGEIVIELTYGRLGTETCREYIDRSMSIAQVVLEATQGHVVDLLPFCESLSLSIKIHGSLKFHHLQ